jgi:hypothetical protein
MCQRADNYSYSVLLYFCRHTTYYCYIGGHGPAVSICMAYLSTSMLLVYYICVLLYMCPHTSAVQVGTGSAFSHLHGLCVNEHTTSLLYMCPAVFLASSYTHTTGV